VFVEFSLY